MDSMPIPPCGRVLPVGKGYEWKKRLAAGNWIYVPPPANYALLFYYTTLGEIMTWAKYLKAYRNIQKS